MFNGLIMKRIIYSLLLVVFAFATSCSKDEEPVVIPKGEEFTLFMYMPWSGNLTSYFKQNLIDVEDAILNRGLKDERVIVFFAESSTEATLYEFEVWNGEVVRRVIAEYDQAAFTTPEQITSIINDVKIASPTKRYSMIVSAHGVGWLPVATQQQRRSTAKYHWEFTDEQGNALTRYFGGTTSEFQVNIPDFAAGIKGAGIVMDYILFDDCYMSNVEVAYDLQGAAKYLIGCPTEVMGYGFPYSLIGGYLMDGDNNFSGIVDGFYDFYTNYTSPYGTISVIDVDQVEPMAQIMKRINAAHTLDAQTLPSVQKMDGYWPTMFYDMGSYVRLLCDSDQALYSEFQAQLELLCPSQWHRHTAQYPSSLGGFGVYEINEYSGITISDPSTNSLAVGAKLETAWYRATH